jgi:very-short-patch-repair endonuclease
MGAASALSRRRRLSASASNRSYVADFYCPAAKLVIEIDGLIHDFTVERDEARDEYMRSLGLKIIRIAASDVMADALSIADGLLRLCGPSTAQLR